MVLLVNTDRMVELVGAVEPLPTDFLRTFRGAADSEQQVDAGVFLGGGDGLRHIAVGDQECPRPCVPHLREGRASTIERVRAGVLGIVWKGVGCAGRWVTATHLLHKVSVARAVQDGNADVLHTAIV